MIIFLKKYTSNFNYYPLHTHHNSPLLHHLHLPFLLPRHILLHLIPPHRHNQNDCNLFYIF